MTAMNEKFLRHVARYIWLYVIAVSGLFWIAFVSFLIVLSGVVK